MKYIRLLSYERGGAMTGAGQRCGRGRAAHSPLVYGALLDGALGQLLTALTAFFVGCGQALNSRALKRCAMLLLSYAALSAQTEPVLVPEVSQHEVQVRQGFTGAELLLFGAILDPAGARGGDGYDVVVVLKGPTDSVMVREKQRIAGIWVNAASTTFRSAPAFFAVASSRPIADIVDDQSAMIYELGVERIQYSPSGTIDLDEQERFRAGLIDLATRQGFYKEDSNGVQISEKVLYQARISMPSSVQTGTYTAETFAISEGQVVASAVAEVAVRKVGLDREIERFAFENGWLYGILAVLMSVAMGFIAGRFFTLK